MRYALRSQCSQLDYFWEETIQMNGRHRGGASITTPPFREYSTQFRAWECIISLLSNTSGGANWSRLSVETNSRHVRSVVLSVFVFGKIPQSIQWWSSEFRFVSFRVFFFFNRTRLRWSMYRSSLEKFFDFVLGWQTISAQQSSGINKRSYMNIEHCPQFEESSIHGISSRFFGWCCFLLLSRFILGAFIYRWNIENFSEINTLSIPFADLGHPLNSKLKSLIKFNSFGNAASTLVLSRIFWESQTEFSAIALIN